MQTHFGRVAAATPLGRRHLELLVGCLMGDGTLLRTTAGYCFRVHHSVAQRALVDWKYEQLRAFVRTAPRICAAGCYFRTISHPELLSLRGAFYVDDRKCVPLDLLRRHLSSFALAVWIMDDGAADGRQLRLNTQCFTWEDCVLLVALLEQKFGLSFTVNSDKGRPRIRCRAGSMQRLRRLTEAFILPELRYKLGSPN